MKNFLRIRDGDRFWYEHYLSQEVTMELFIPCFQINKLNLVLQNDFQARRYILGSFATILQAL